MAHSTVAMEMEARTTPYGGIARRRTDNWNIRAPRRGRLIKWQHCVRLLLRAG
jgi:hypothetical protein